MNNLALVHDLLAAVEHRPVTDALAAYDAAMSARLAHRPPPERRKAAEAALRAEHLAAVAEGRAPKLTGATLTAADEATTDDQFRTDALDEHVRRRMAALDAAVAAGAAHVWHAIAKALQHDETSTDAAEALWGQLRLPPLYATPGIVQQIGPRYRLLAWYPPALRQPGIVPGPASDLAGLRQLVERHVHSEMALPEGRGWRIHDDGSLRLLTPWPPSAPIRPGLPDDPAYIPPNFHRVDFGGHPARTGLQDGALVWIGRGPNGERGYTEADLPNLQPAGMNW